MSAAEPVDRNPGIMNAGDAAVIDIGRRGTKTAAKGRWKRVSTPRPGDGPDSLVKLANHIETTFNERHLTLSDDDTATAYTLTVGIVRGLLAGAQAKGIVDGAQYAELDTLIEGMLSAPRLV